MKQIIVTNFHKVLVLIVTIILILVGLLAYVLTLDTQDISKNELQIYTTKAENWIINNQNVQGYFNYLYDPSTEEYSTSNNMIRQLMASRLLAEMSADNELLQEAHQKNLDYVFSQWYRENNEFGYIYYNSKSKLGAIAMALRTLVYSPFYDTYQNHSTKLAQTIMSLQHEDGSFEPWYIAPDYEYDSDYLLTFYSGEAILSLVELYSKTNKSIYLDAAIRSQDFYITEYVVNLSENYYPAYIPWHTQSLNKLYKLTGNQTYAEAIFTLNDKLLEIQDASSFSLTIGRFYNRLTPEYGSPHSSSDAVYTEGLAYAYEIAVLVNDTEHAAVYEYAISIAIDNLLSLQYDSSDERIDGAIKISIEDDRIRVDTTQHAIDAFQKIIKVLN